MFRTLLDGLDIARTLITADCLHTQRGHAEYLYRRGADFIFCVKGNQPKLFEALDVLPWRDVPITHRQTDRGHGRITTRTIQVLPCPHDLPFPHVKQVFLIERHVTDLAGNELLTSPYSASPASTPTAAPPKRSLDPCDTTGESRSFTGSETPSTAKITPPPVPDPAPETWRRYATLPSAPSASPDAPTSPKPPAGRHADHTDPSTYSASPCDLETAVPAAPRNADRI